MKQLLPYWREILSHKKNAQINFTEVMYHTTNIKLQAICSAEEFVWQVLTLTQHFSSDDKRLDRQVSLFIFLIIKDIFPIK